MSEETMAYPTYQYIRLRLKYPKPCYYCQPKVLFEMNHNHHFSICKIALCKPTSNYIIAGINLVHSIPKEIYLKQNLYKCKPKHNHLKDMTMISST